jgi:hypothetical protein
MRWDEPAPREHDAEERSWKVVRAAWQERVQPARPNVLRRRWPVAAFAAGLAVVAAAFSSPGMAVLGSIRDVVRGEKNASPALYRLPAPGQLLVESDRGVWIVRRDGARRLLRGYRDAAWSPNAKFIAAVHGHELRALEPSGAVHWSLARRGRLALPRWSGDTPPCCRIAYLAGTTLRVVNGDNTGDRVVAKGVAHVAPVWRPRTHVLAYVDRTGHVRVADADAGTLVRSVRPSARPVGLDWSADGRYLLVRGPRSIELFGARGQHIEVVGAGAAPVVDAAFSPDGRSIAFVQTVPTRDGRRSLLWLAPRIRPDGTAATSVFGGAGAFGGVDWSPDGRWLLLDWDSADQWLFIRSESVKAVTAVSNVRASFGPDTNVAGWCCP